jgi:hypothetical protein
MTRFIRFSSAFLLACLPFVSVVAAQQHPTMPAGMTHEEHMAQMKKDAEMKQHGAMAMGFDQDKATHHFTLTANGGAIAVGANDPADQATRDQIQAHLKEIAAAFGRGEFDKPLMTHGEMPPGVSAMQRHKSEITYTFERSERGGIVRIATPNADALSAIHDFLRYQIKEHSTGDPVSVQK